MSEPTNAEVVAAVADYLALGSLRSLSALGYETLTEVGLRLQEIAVGMPPDAPTWPALDFGACRSLYTDLHEAMAQYGDPDDANRVHDFNRALREHLPVLRGGATAPPPDPTTVIAREDVQGIMDALNDIIVGLALRVGQSDARPFIPAKHRAAVERVSLWLRRDTGASHE
jgi:hypothetical protein